MLRSGMAAFKTNQSRETNKVLKKKCGLKTVWYQNGNSGFQFLRESSRNIFNITWDGNLTSKALERDRAGVEEIAGIQQSAT